MKKILFIIGLFTCTLINAQVKQFYNQYGGQWKRFQIDTALRLPLTPKSTKNFSNPAIDSGQVYYDASDSTVKYHTGFQWLTLSGGIGGSSINNANVGSGYRLLVPSNQDIKTLFAGYSLKIDSTSNSDGLTIGLDTSVSDLRYLHNSVQCGLTCSGCGNVVWSGTGLTFDVSAAFYNLYFIPYSFSGGSITLSNGDATFDRFDAIVLTASGLDKIEGTPSSDPQLPQFDPCQNILLTYVFVQNNVTTFTPSLEVVVYDEDAGGEWTHTTGGSITANFVSTAQAVHGTKSIAISNWSNNANIIFTAASPVQFGDVNTFSFYIYLTTSMASNQNISIRFFNGTTAVSNLIPAQINKTFINGWQQIFFNISQFSPFTNIAFDKIRLLFSGSNSNTVYIDWIRLQNGITQAPSQTENIYRFGKSGEDAIASENRAFDANYHTFVITKITSGELKAGTSTNYMDDTFDSTYRSILLNNGSDFYSFELNKASKYWELISKTGSNEAGILAQDDSLKFNSTAGKYVYTNLVSGYDTLLNKPAVFNQLGQLVKSNSWYGGTGGGMIIGNPITSATSGSVLYAGTNGLLQQSNSEFFYDSTNKRLAINYNSPASRLHLLTPSIGTTQSDAYGLLLANNTAAAAGAQQLSPGLVFQGNGWKTDATAESQDVRFRFDVLPVQGSANPSGTLRITSSINDGGYSLGSGLLTFTSGGLLTASNITASSFLTATGIFTANSGFSVQDATNTNQWINGTGSNSLNSRLTSSFNKTLSANNNYVTNYFSGSTLIEASSGVHDVIANTIIGRNTINNGTATTNYAASLYIQGSSVGTATISNGNYALWIDSSSSRFDGRVIRAQGADVASIAGAIALGDDGNTFEITGTNAITLISNLGWQNGSEVTLIFTSTASLTDGTSNSGTDIGMELAGNANFSATADDTITLILCEIGGIQRWREKCRSVN